MALSVSRNPYTGLPDLVGTGGGGGGATFSGGMSTLGNTLGNTGFGTNRLVLAGGNNITLSGSTNAGSMTITISGGAGGGGGIAAAAGTQTATSGTVNFANSNGISFGMSNSSQVTASYTVPSTAGLLSAVNFSAGTTSNNTSQISFANGNGVSFGLNAGTITASHNGLTSQSNQALSGSNGSFAFQTATFGNLNGLSFYTSNGSLVGSHNGVTSQSNPAFSASGGSSTFQTLTFANSNGLTFSNSNGSVVGSYTVPTQSAQTVGAYAVSNTTGAASSTTLDARSFSFQGAGIASVGMTNGSVVISVPSGGGAGDGGNVLAAGTQTANTTGTVVFSNSNGVTFGMSNNSVITASVAGGGADGVNIIAAGTQTAGTNATVVFSNSNRITFGMNNSSVVTASFSQTDPTVSAFEPKPLAGLQAMVASSLLFQRFNSPNNISATELDLIVGVSGSASAGGTLTYTAALYTQTGSTLSMASSASVSYGFNSTAAASSYTALSATRFHSMPVTFNVTPGDYYMGFIFNSTSSGTVGTYSVAGNGSQLTLQQLPFGGGNRTYHPIYGVYSAATTAPPASINISQVVQTSNVAIRPPWFALFGTF